MDREILHIDMNNFFASVECLYDPSLKNIPMAVAGSKENRHGIVLAKNQLAKACGVKTAEALWEAERKCPNITFVKPHGDRYEKYSKAAMEIYLQYTDQVESFGMDECWLDVTGSTRLFGSGKTIGEEIRGRIKEELGLTVSVGVSYNKVFAKLGSDYKKPDAVTEITRENFQELLWPLPAGDLLYVGPATQKSLEKYGIHTIGALAKTDQKILSSLFGKSGDTLWRYANGLDTSPVANISDEREVKSIGNSSTGSRDLFNVGDVKKALYPLAESVAERLRRHGLWARCVQLSVRRSNLTSYVRSRTLDTPVNDSESLFQTAFQLYLESEEQSAIRSMGIRAEHLSDTGNVQCSLFQNPKDLERRDSLEKTIDSVRERYGKESICRALLYHSENSPEEESPVKKVFLSHEE